MCLKNIYLTCKIEKAVFDLLDKLFIRAKYSNTKCPLQKKMLYCYEK